MPVVIPNSNRDQTQHEIVTSFFPISARRCFGFILFGEEIGDLNASFTNSGVSAKI